MRSEINALRPRVRALQRKLARELAAYRLDLLSRDLCHRWFVAQSDQKSLPEIQPFIRRVIDAGYRLLPLDVANNYLLNCPRKKTAPTPKRSSTPFSPRPRNIPPMGLSADGKIWPAPDSYLNKGTRASRPHQVGTTLHMPSRYAPAH